MWCVCSSLYAPLRKQQNCIRATLTSARKKALSFGRFELNAAPRTLAVSRQALSPSLYSSTPPTFTSYLSCIAQPTPTRRAISLSSTHVPHACLSNHHHYHSALCLGSSFHSRHLVNSRLRQPTAKLATSKPHRAQRNRLAGSSLPHLIRPLSATRQPGARSPTKTLHLVSLPRSPPPSSSFAAAHFNNPQQQYPVSPGAASASSTLRRLQAKPKRYSLSLSLREVGAVATRPRSSARTQLL